MNSSSLEITIPVLNEENRLAVGVRKLFNALKDRAVEPRIVIADNGSKDKTLEIAKNLAEEFPGLRILSTPKPGVGLALQTSWNSSRADWVGYVDVDHSTDLRHLDQVLTNIHQNRFNVVSGSRLLDESIVQGRNWKREIASRGLNFILQQSLDVHFSDGMCGFKFLKKPLFLEIQEKLGPLDEGWFFNTEILVKSEWLGEWVLDIPVRWTDDADSRVNIPRLTKSYLKEIYRLYREKPRD